MGCKVRLDALDGSFQVQHKEEVINMNQHHDTNITAPGHVDRVITIYMFETDGGEYQMKLQCPGAQPCLIPYNLFRRHTTHCFRFSPDQGSPSTSSPSGTTCKSLGQYPPSTKAFNISTNSRSRSSAATIAITVHMAAILAVEAKIAL